MVKKNRYKNLIKFFLFITLNVLCTATVIWVAYSNRVKIKRWLVDHDNDFTKEDKIILYDLFSSPLIDNQNDLLFPPVRNSDDLIKYLINSSLPDSLDLLSIYNSCKVVSTEKYREGILRIKYTLYADTLECYTYFTKTNSGKKNTKVVLYTSGSGDDRAQKVAHRLLDIEDPTKQAEQVGADIYFPIFPADDILAIHDGTKMLDIKKIPSYLVSINRNIPLRYLANIFALEKYLRSNYSILHSWGHSRGSITATLTASIFSPDTLIANSGYAISLEKFFRLGPDQIWWPHSYSYLNKDTLKKRFCGQKTKIFFLYGAKEVEDIYGLETWKHYTAVFFKDCSNVKVRYTNEKHVWSSGDISKILSGK